MSTQITIPVSQLSDTPPPAQRAPQSPQTITISPADFDKLLDAPPQPQPPAPQAGSAQSVTTPSIGPAPKTSDVSNADIAQTVSGGNPVTYAEARLSLPVIKALMKAHDALKSVEDYTQQGREQHPILAKVGDTAAAIEGLLTGNTDRPDQAIGTGKYGMLTNPVTGLLTPAGPESVGAKAVEGAGEAIDATRAASAVKSAETEGPGLIKQITKGKAVEQAPAQAAIRQAVGAADNEPILEANSTVLDSKLNQIRQQEDAAYQKLDDASGFDLKDAKQSLKNKQWQIKQPGANEEKLQGQISDLQQNIGDAEQRLKDQGIDPKEGDSLHASRMAGQEFKKVLVRNTSPDGQAVNVDGLLKQSKQLRFTKYGDRLAQFMGGKDQANEFMANLEVAQAAGAHAVKVQNVAKWIGGIAVGSGVASGVGTATYELLK